MGDLGTPCAVDVTMCEVCVFHHLRPDGGRLHHGPHQRRAERPGAARLRALLLLAAGYHAGALHDHRQRRGLGGRDGTLAGQSPGSGPGVLDRMGFQT